MYRMRELSEMDCMADLERATASFPRKPELYYFAARLELSKASPEEGVSGGGNKSCEMAVQWLVKCARSYYTELPKQLSTKEVLILYRWVVQWLIACMVGRRWGGHLQWGCAFNRIVVQFSSTLVTSFGTAYTNSVWIIHPQYLLSPFTMLLCLIWWIFI